MLINTYRHNASCRDKISIKRGAFRVLVGKPEGKNRWGDLDVDGWIILGWISRRWVVGVWTELG